LLGWDGSACGKKSTGIITRSLADKADIDRSYMGGIERGEHNIAIINLLKIANALGTKASLLLDKAGN